ncbi:MAG: hypothetical protein IBJ16_10965 [Chitinophagaceae bacterium]|nr:hypothetical protein [Chitinophagaceae bacterium]
MCDFVVGQATNNGEHLLSFRNPFFVALTLMAFTFIACQKTSSLSGELKAKQAEVTFYNNTDQLNPTLTALVNSFKTQPVFSSQLAAFIEKNGVPVWDKTIYSLGGEANTGSAEVKSNGIGTFSTTGGVSDTSKGLFLIPLKSQKTGDVQSYITAYKHNDSNYSYRLYNKDSLDRIRPVKDTVKSLLTATEAIFAVFEKSINNKDSINISGTTIRNASLKFGKSQASNNKKSNWNNVKSNTICITTITITIYYEEVMFSYPYGPPVYRVSSIEVSTSVSCFGPEEVQEMQPDMGGGGGNWWEYGTGWPWNIAFGDTQGDDPWAFWWTGYSLPYDPYSPENLNAFANSLGRYWEDPSYDNVPFPAYDPNVDGPYNSEGYRKMEEYISILAERYKIIQTTMAENMRYLLVRVE